MRIQGRREANERNVSEVSARQVPISPEIPGHELAAHDAGHELSDALFDYWSPRNKSEAGRIIKHCEPTAREDE
jgi:hypothetical protein